jgi:hypothetical protein
VWRVVQLDGSSTAAGRNVRPMYSRGIREWERVAVGERRLGVRLDSLTGQGIVVLHDRRVPGSRTNIDHIAVTPTGVRVIDTERYQGRPALRFEGGILRPRVQPLLVGTGTAPGSSTAPCARSTWSASHSFTTTSRSRACSVSSMRTGHWSAVPSPSGASKSHRRGAARERSPEI